MKFVQRIIFKFSCAFKGLFIGVTTDNSFKTHIAVSILVIGAGFYFQFDWIEWCLIAFAIGFVFISELFNTAIEHLVKLFTDQYHELAEKLLDISAGAVLFASITSIVVGCIVFGRRILMLFP